MPNAGPGPALSLQIRVIGPSLPRFYFNSCAKYINKITEDLAGPQKAHPEIT